MDIRLAPERLRRDPTHEGVGPIEYLDRVSSTAFVKEYKAFTHQALGARPGALLLDVGCGTGDDVVAMAHLVQPGGSAVGVDLNPRMVAEAWKRLGALKIPASFRVCDAHQLDFDSGTFDGVRCDRVLQHVDDPKSVLAEMTRVTRCGGRVVAIEPDWDTFTIDCPARETTRKLAAYMAERSVRHGWIGRELYRFLHQLHLQDVQIRSLALVLTDLASAEQIWGLSRHARAAGAVGLITESESVQWRHQLEDADRAGYFFSTAVGYMVYGTKV